MVLKQEAAVSNLFLEFVPPDVSLKSFEDVVDFILLIYARRRGEDFAMKLLKKNTSIKLPARQIQAVLFDPKHRVKIKGATNLVYLYEAL